MSDFAVSQHSTGLRIPGHVWIFISFIIAAAAMRAGRIGDPAIHVDEEFYLLVADRMWHGALPYVDIWDRKPILLFLIYAALRPLSHDGIAAYQIGAMVFAAATAFIIFLIAGRFTNMRGAWLAGAAYLIYLPLLNGGGGQSPVFYNLFMAIGALEVIRAETAGDISAIRRHGLRCMIWAGLAIQLKYTAAIEGIAYGLWLIMLLVRHRCSVPRIAAQTGLWIAVAIAPTLAAAGFYVLTGHGEAFMQANFMSVFQKHEPDTFVSIESIELSALRLTPLLITASLSIPLLRRTGAAGAPLPFLLFWTAFAILDFFSIGNYYEHYALPLLVPMVIACAPLLGTIAGLPIVPLGFCAIMASGFPTRAVTERHEGRIAAMVDAVRPYVAHGCIYVNDGPPILYLLTHSCLPSRYAFPTHLNDVDEASATSATRSMADLLATRPSAIFVADRPQLHTRNPITAAMLNAVLESDYERIASMPDVFGDRWQILYARKDLLAR